MWILKSTSYIVFFFVYGFIYTNERFNDLWCGLITLIIIKYFLIFLQIREEFIDTYKTTHNNLHTEIVSPMTQEQIIKAAQKLKIDVNEMNFDKVYPG